MPSQQRRRRLRAGIVTRLITKPIFLNGAQGETEAVKIQSYLSYAVNTVSQQNAVAATVSVLQGVIGQVQTRVEYYKILDTIEEQILAILCNMGDNISPGIIKLRLECVRNSIRELPIEGPEFATKDMHDMLFNILDMILNGMSLTNIAENIIKLQQYTQEAYNRNSLLTQVQNTILEIICNISEGTPSGIIACRIDFLKGLITQLEIID
jgi:hypothetical protein